MIRTSAALASAAALLFVAGSAAADNPNAGMPAHKVRCQGVNACKGQGACHSEANECAGHNACKGKGFLMLSQQECDAAKAKLKESSK